MKKGTIEERSEGFNKEFVVLLKKWGLGLGAQPVVNGKTVPSSDFLSAIPVIVEAPEESTKKEDVVEAA